MFIAVLENGLWYARSAELVKGAIFQTLTYFRSLGGMVFVFGGLLPLLWFILSRGSKLLPETKGIEKDWPQYEAGWAN